MSDALLPLLVFLPLLGALVPFVLGDRAPRFGLGVWPLIVAAVTAAGAAALAWTVAGPGEPLIHHLGGWREPLGIRLRADGLAAVMIGLTAVVGAAVSVAAQPLYGPGKPGAPHFHALWLLLWGSLNALFLSGDLFNLYVALELVSLSAIPMVLLAGPGKTVQATLDYLHYALFGSLIYLAGVALVYAATGTLDLALIADRLPEAGVAGGFAAACLVVGVLIKAAIVPFHAWLPEAHGGAPAVVSALLSALVVKSCVYLLLRLWAEPLAGMQAPAAAQGLGALGAAAILYGSVQALRQERLKMVVAYSTVAQLGYMLLFFPLAVLEAWQGAVYHGVAHGVAKAALFLAAGNILLHVGHDRMRELRGVDRPLSVSLFAFAVAGVSIMGLPPSGGFIGKWLLLTASLETGQWWWALVLIVGGLLAAAYIFRVLGFAFLKAEGPGPTVEEPARASPGRLLARVALFLALLSLGLGFTAPPVFELLGDPPGGGP